ncbi:MAG: methionine--tRNA ligase [Bacilli bacterium]|nr:methionine--tRNA ligase [Bacilli bacterium]
MCKNCYITTPIYYASGYVHVGNAYTTIAADTLARYKRLEGKETYYLTGMDEHGLKIQEAAEKQGKTPQQLVDDVAEHTLGLWKHLGVTNDGFIRTSDPRHMAKVSELFEKFLASDDIYLSEYTGDYCVACEAFFTKTQLGENNTCPDCGKPTRKVSEQSYFFRLKKYEKQLLDFIKANPDFIQPETRRNEVVSFIESGLEDLCVSRTSFSWGIPVTSNPKHVIYVWLDALFNYLTAINYDEHDDSLYQKYWANNKEIYQLVGKDILRFHAVYWPIFLMAAGIPINFKLYVHGWILMKDGKMSKSRGNVVYPYDVTSRYGIDALRYYLVKELPIGNDGLFTYERFFERYNSELANDLGNLVSRTISMINKYFGGKIEKGSVATPFDKDFEDIINDTIVVAKEEYSAFHLQNALTKVWQIVTRANKYIDETAPWVLAKDDAKQEELKSVMYHLAEALRIASTLLAPVLIETCPKVIEYLGIQEEMSVENLTFGYEYKNNVVSSLQPLFKRLDVQKELVEVNTPKVVPMDFKSNVAFDDFEKLDLRVGEIIECKKVEKSDKLLVSQVQIGTETRQIVSGIAETYKPEDLIGKKVLVVVNLNPAKIRGVESSGMLLCASDGKTLQLVEISNVNSGVKVK